MSTKSSGFAISRLSLAVATLAITPQLFAANESIPLIETVTVVSSRTPTPLRELGTSLSVLDESHIKARGFASLVDVLRVMPSVAVSNAGGMGSPTSISVRGEQGYRTQVRIDGVDVSDPTPPQSYTQIQHVMSANISRVELLRGPQGMMYGADAGGVLLISTPTVKDGFKADANLEGGSLGTQNISGGIGGGSEVGNVYLSASHNTTDGFNSSKKDFTKDLDGYDNTTAHLRGDINLSEAWTLETVLRKTKGDNEYDRCGWPNVDDCHSEFTQKNARAALRHETDNGENSLAFNRADLDRTTFASGKKELSYEGQISRWEFNGHYRFNEQQQVVYGLEKRSDEAADNRRDQKGVYAEYQGRYDNHVFVTAGVRHDDNDDFGTYDSYRVSGAYIAPWVESGVLKFKSSAGTGFRAPSLYEVDYNRQAKITASPLSELLPVLKAEESKGADIGVEYYFSDVNRIEMTLFKQNISNEIYFDLDNYSGYFQGQQTSRSDGVELASDLSLSNQLTLNANYTRTHTEADASTPRLRKPKNMANLGLTYKPDSALTFSMNVRGASDAIDGDKKPLDNYAVADASVSYELSKSQKLVVRGENIFNKRYIEVRNYNTAEATWYAGVNLTF